MQKSSIIETLLERVLYLTSAAKKLGGYVEVESRMGLHTERGFNPSVGRARWLMAKQSLDSLDLEPVEMTIQTEHFGSLGIRRRTITVGEVKKRIIEGKYSTANIDDDWINWTRYSLSIEIPNQKLPENILVETTTVNTSRTRYSWKALNCYVDLSQVENQGRITYQIEVEMMANNNFTTGEIKNFLLCTRKVTMMMHGSRNYFNMEQMKILNATVNDYIPVSGISMFEAEQIRLDRVDLRVMAEPRPLKMFDLQTGTPFGLVGGNVIYDVGHKIDGTHFLLVISHNSIWLIASPYQYNLLTKDVGHVVGKDDFSVFEVEVLDPSAKVPVIYVIDCLVVQGLNIKTFHKATRCKKGKTFIFDLYNRRAKTSLSSDGSILVEDVTKDFSEKVNISVFPNVFALHWKDVTPARSIDEFQSIVRFLLDQQESGELPYKTDGLIFTPINHPYDFAIHFGKDKTVGKPPIIKWKPPEMITIDFRIRKSAHTDEIVLFVDDRDSHEKAGKIIETDFSEIQGIGFDPKTMIDTSSIPAMAIGGIGEFGWDYKREVLVYQRSRETKASANRKAVAVDNWKLIRERIDADTLMGLGLGQLKFYHNRIKDQLFSESSGILLDGGSGEGGDVRKWLKSGYRIVFCVEVSRERIEQKNGLRERATAAGFIERRIGDSINIPDPMIVIINTGFEDTRTIIDTINRILNPDNKPDISTRVDAVSIMDVGTFFWKNHSMLESVVNTIKYALKPDGKILWKMMDGDAVRLRFAQNRKLPVWKAFSAPLTAEDKIDYGLFSVQSTGNGNQVVTTFRGGIGELSEGQTEYLTRITDFYQMLGVDFSVIYQGRADNPKHIILTGQSRLVSSLYIFGVIGHEQNNEVEKQKKSPLFSLEPSKIEGGPLPPVYIPYAGSNVSAVVPSVPVAPQILVSTPVAATPVATTAPLTPGVSAQQEPPRFITRGMTVRGRGAGSMRGRGGMSAGRSSGFDLQLQHRGNIVPLSQLQQGT
jgi:hypothetical protein